MNNLSKSAHTMLAMLIISPETRPYEGLGVHELDARVLPSLVRRGFVEVRALPLPGGKGDSIDVAYITWAGRKVIDAEDRASGVTAGPTLLKSLRVKLGTWPALMFDFGGRLPKMGQQIELMDRDEKVYSARITEIRSLGLGNLYVAEQF